MDGWIGEDSNTTIDPVIFAHTSVVIRIMNHNNRDEREAKIWDGLQTIQIKRIIERNISTGIILSVYSR